MALDSVLAIRRKVIREVCGDNFVEIAQSDGYPWNGWCIAENGFASFRTGVFWDYLEKMKRELERAGLQDTEEYRRVVEELREIEEEWREVTGQ